MLVVSDDPLARTGLALLLGGQEGLIVTGQVGVDDDWPDTQGWTPPSGISGWACASASSGCGGWGRRLHRLWR